MSREQALERKVEEIFYNEIIALPNNKKLLGAEIEGKVMLYFINNLGDNTDSWRTYFEKVAQKLIDSEYLFYQKMDHSIHWSLTKGLNYNEWENKLKNNNSENITIKNINATNVQLGNQNKQVNNTNISISELVKEISESGDKEAKNKLVAFLENNTTASIIGAGVTSLLELLK